MTASKVIELRLPGDVVDTLQAYGDPRATEAERIRLPLAIGLFAERAISLAKAASLAGVSRYEFAQLLQKRGLSAYEYTDTDFQKDLDFVRLMREQPGDTA